MQNLKMQLNIMAERYAIQIIIGKYHFRMHLKIFDMQLPGFFDNIETFKSII